MQSRSSTRRAERINIDPLFAFTICAHEKTAHLGMHIGDRSSGALNLPRLQFALARSGIEPGDMFKIKKSRIEVI